MWVEGDSKEEKRCYDKKMKEEYSAKVRGLMKLIHELDPRIDRNVYYEVVESNVSRDVSKVERERKIKKKKKKEDYVYYCDSCNKGFMSSNQGINHRRSKKHIENLMKNGSNVDFMRGLEEREEITSERVSDSGSGPSCKESSQENENAEEETVKGSMPSDRKPGQRRKKRAFLHRPKESEQFLTCSICKEAFPSRSSLFSHIRDAHAFLT
jgi:uncharacterized C2H2 Zn-finger protein